MLEPFLVLPIERLKNTLSYTMTTSSSIIYHPATLSEPFFFIPITITATIAIWTKI